MLSVHKRISFKVRQDGQGLGKSTKLCCKLYQLSEPRNRPRLAGVLMAYNGFAHAFGLYLGRTEGL